MGVLFYRCELCGNVVAPWDIKKGGCPKCAGTRIRPTNLSFWEKVKALCTSPFFWTWGK